MSDCLSSPRMRCLPTEITCKPDILLKISAPPERRTEGKWKRKQAQGGKNWPWGTENWEEVFWKQIPDVVH